MTPQEPDVRKAVRERTDTCPNASEEGDGGAAKRATVWSSGTFVASPPQPTLVETDGSAGGVADSKRSDREQMRLLSEAVRNLAEGVLITSGELEWPGPHIIFVNEAMSRITGYAADEMIGRTPRMFQGKRTDRWTLDRMKASVRTGEPCSVELINYRKDGSVYDVELLVSPVRDEHGRVTHFVSIHHDITRRKLSEERLLQSERLAAIGQTIAGLAHESRNALQRSKACLEMLRDSVGGNTEALDFIGRAQKAQDHLQHLYEEVCGYAAPISPQRDDVDLAEVWRESWSHLVQSRDHKNVQMEEKLENQDLRCAVDRHCMLQLFRNILENAIYACPDPGKIVIRCNATEWAARPALRISFWNDGPPFTPDERARIFDPFFTTKTHGTGLGMAIAQRIVSAHDGWIAVGETANRGAEVVIILPQQTLGQLGQESGKG